MGFGSGKSRFEPCSVTYWLSDFGEFSETLSILCKMRLKETCTFWVVLRLVQGREFGK